MFRRWKHLPLVYKVLSGNAIVIIVGAIGGTYITQRLLEVSGTQLALFFASVGIALSLVINYRILRGVLHPVDALQRTVERIDRGDTDVRASVEEIDDPQLQRFAQSLNRMLARLAAHTRMIEANRAQLQTLSSQVLSAQEDERKRLARELHDDTSGSLARILLNIEMCEDLVPADWQAMREKIRGTRALCEQTLDGVHKMIFDLRPTLLDDLGLASAVRWYAKNNLEPAGIQVQLEINDNFGRLAPAVESAMFRIAQEAMTNIVRHSKAQRGHVRLTREDSKLILTVQDNGRGFDTNAFGRGADAPHRWGLFGIQERVAALGGTFKIESGVGQGTTLYAEIPIE
jgi:two-component system sensor histidine kinase UhpB